MKDAQNQLNTPSQTTDGSAPASDGFNEKNPDCIAAENSVLNEIVRASGLDAMHAPDQQLLRTEFLQIATRLKDVEFSVSPVVTSLVHVALGKLSGIDDATAAQLEQYVANSMCENTETHIRVRRFWDSLVKIVNESER